MTVASPDPDDGRPSPEELETLREVMELAGEFESRIVKALRVAAISRKRYIDFYRLYEDRASQVEAEAVNYDWPYPFDDYTGRFRLGINPAGDPVGLTEEEVNEHMLIVGRTGAGKTTLFYNLMDECVGLDVPFMVFDFKNDYRHLVQHRDVLVVNWRDLKFNPLRPPPGVAIGKWGEVIADTFAHSTDLLIGSETYLLEKLQHLYRLYDIDTAAAIDREETCPSLFELQHLVGAHEIPMASPRFNYKERVWGRLSMMTGFSGDIFDCSAGYPIEELLERNVVFELQEPNQYVANFVVEAVLTWLFYYRDVQGHRGSQLRHVVLFDEAKRVFDVNKERQPEGGLPPIDDLVGKVREFGEALVVADHEPSKLTDSIKANTNAKLWLSLGSGKDTREMATTFGLDEEETDFTRTLEKGESVLWVVDRDPIPVMLPDYQLEKTVSEQEVREKMESDLEALAWESRVRPDRFRKVVGEPLEKDSTESQKQLDEQDEWSVGEVAEALLVSVNTDPFVGVSDRYDLIGVVPRKGNAAKEELSALRLVREQVVPTGKPGRNPTLLELTDEGCDMLEDKGYEVAPTGRRGIVHRYWQHQVKQHYENQGFEVEIEKPVGQQSIDVYAESDAGDRVAVEVACSPEHEVENVEKCVEFGADTVQVLCLEDGVREQIEAAIRRELERVPNVVEFVGMSSFT